MRVLGIVLVVIGVTVIAYTMMVRLTGGVQITDLIPVHWLTDLPRSDYYKVIPTSEPSDLWLYTIAIAFVVTLYGWFLLKRYSALKR